MNESLFVTMVKDLKGLIVQIYLFDTPIIPALIPLPPNLNTLIDIHVPKVYIHTHVDVAGVAVAGVAGVAVAGVAANTATRREYRVLGWVFGSTIKKRTQLFS